MEKYLMLKFKGNKVEIHKQLKIRMVQAERTMNDHVINLIKKDNEKSKQKNKKIR